MRIGPYTEVLLFFLEEHLHLISLCVSFVDLWKSPGRKHSDRLADFWGEVQKQTRGTDVATGLLNEGFLLPAGDVSKDGAEKGAECVFLDQTEALITLWVNKSYKAHYYWLYSKSHLDFYSAVYNKDCFKHEQENSRINDANFKYVANSAASSSTKTLVSLFSSVQFNSRFFSFSCRWYCWI